MKISIKAACLAAALLSSGTAIASAQGGSTDSRGNAMGSERVGNGPTVPSGGAMRQETPGTTGMNTRRSEQDSPNGSPNTPPTAKEGPAGDPSRDNDAPK
jgi:hypothetical protein